jgi:hypothetical protein
LASFYDAIPFSTKRKERKNFVRCDSPPLKMKIVRTADANQENIEKAYQTFNQSKGQSMYFAFIGNVKDTGNGNYVFNALAGKEFKIKEKHILALDVKVTYAGGKRYVPIDLAASIAYKDEVRDGTQAYNPQYDPYFRIDVKPSYKLNTKRFTHEISVDIQNITKHNNIFQQQYDLNTQTIKTDYQLKFFVIPQYRLTF